MSAQEDYERLERALLELEQSGLMRTSWQSRKAWSPREERKQRTAFRSAIQDFWKSRLDVTWHSGHPLMDTFFWYGGKRARYDVILRLDRRLWSLGFFKSGALLSKMYPDPVGEV